MEKAHQAIHDWKIAIIPPQENTPQTEFARLMEENIELYVEMSRYDGTKKSKDNVAGEATDVILRHIGLIDSLGGYNLDSLVDGKLRVIQKKYDPVKVNGFKKQGMHWTEAMSKAKGEFKAA